MTAKNAKTIIAAAIASAIAIGASAMPAYASTATSDLPTGNEISLVAQACILTPEEAEHIACESQGWNWSDVDYCSCDEVLDDNGCIHHYEIHISVTSEIEFRTVCVDVYTGAIL